MAGVNLSELLKKMIEMGFTFVTVGGDNRFMTLAGQAAAAALDEIGELVGLRGADRRHRLLTREALSHAVGKSRIARLELGHRCPVWRFSPSNSEIRSRQTCGQATLTKSDGSQQTITLNRCF